MAAYLRGLLAEVERKNGWTLAETAGEAGPQGKQRLLNFYAWDADGLRDDVHDAVVEALADAERGVLIADETGFVKKGTKSAGVARLDRFKVSAADGLDRGQCSTWASEVKPLMVSTGLMIRSPGWRGRKGH